MIFQYDNSNIYYEAYGNGPAMVLLHGFLESSTIWKNYVTPLSEKYTVIIIDLPGHGKSETITEAHTMELMAKVINELLLSLKISQAILVGHSMGGYISLAFTELFEEKVLKLILLNSTTEADTEERKLNRSRAVKIIQHEKNSFLSMAIANLFSPTSRLSFATEIKTLIKEAQGFSPQGIIANIKGMRDREDRSHILKSFSKEKWIICGTEDSIVPLSTSKVISERTNSNLIILSGSHMSWLESEAEIVKFLLLID